MRLVFEYISPFELIPYSEGVAHTDLSCAQYSRGV